MIAEAVELPGSKGRFEVLKDHAALLSSLDKGTVRWRSSGVEGSLDIRDGFVEVGNNEVKVCVEV